ncbi:hypothetical protein KO527_22565 [Pseudoalteromonas sp. C2R02]|uniref:hypothetical protein n=1 Tax=Pseudoalteromonas sp. C2R02 TaxID=2841565 RepID=UPI001C08DABE|nr:hypothetical protein [Pseudoalteromonas sp. C2R02]MBU2972125.1 hypothetical protein [Pseudoalteromonas sp. C2R02]
MHLNDEQLFAPDPEQSRHLKSCELCSVRLENLKAVQSQLQSLPVLSMPNKSWPNLQLKQQVAHNNILLARNKKRIRRWKLSSLALAASILCVLLVPKIDQSATQEVQSNIQLAELIEQNNWLQQELFKSNLALESTQVDLSLVSSQLSILDLSIQQAYMDQLPAAEVSKLWSQRLKVIKNKIVEKQQLDKA